MAIKYKAGLGVVGLLIAALLGVRVFRSAREASQRVSFAPPPASAARGPCIDFHQAASHAGENTCVGGYVLRAYTSKAGNTFLDFCPDYRNCPFSSVIFASDRTKFGHLEALEGQRVEIRGFVSTYHNQPEIIIHDPWQIRVAP